MRPPVPADKVIYLSGLDMSEPLINFDKLIPDIEDLVKQDLGEVRYQGVVFSGPCHSVDRLKGRLTFIFLGTMPALFQPRLIRGIAVIDTVKNVGEISYSDETDHYPVTEPDRIPTQQEMERVFKALQTELTTNNASDCNLVVSQIGLTWQARCGQLEDFVQTCKYEVSTDGTVTKKAVK
jgi:hypothetical protein